MKKIRVLIVDDSLFTRRLLTEILSQDPRIHVVGAAPDPLVARSMVKRYEPDVLTLDINMPRMSGFDFLERLMRLRPTPVVMFASFGPDGAKEAILALSLGAVEVVAKPCSGTSIEWKDLVDELISKVKFAAAVQVQGKECRATALRGARHSPSRGNVENRVVAIGASTGGVQAIHLILGGLPADSPPILIAQHMPPNFTSSFAHRLNAHSALRVCEASDGEPVLQGHAYIAPGNRHLLLESKSDGYVCRVIEGADIGGHTPSVDELFKSVAATAGRSAMGIVLTGMGRDGTHGLLKIREAGGVTVAQNKSSSLIYGMPKSARDSGAAQYEASLRQVPSLILDGPARTTAIRAIEMVQTGELR